jgi:glucose dehydrogenase
MHSVHSKISRSDRGWLARYGALCGVALGEGRVYAGFLDATVAAIDQQTGEEIWRVPVAPWQEGCSITAAPLYYDGLVINGVSGGVMGRRGRVTAFDADDGSVEWVFYTVPGPGEFGHDIWDYDSPNPVVLFEAEFDGERRRELVQVGKTGWAYILDRVTGEPLVGIEAAVAVSAAGRNNMPSFRDAYSID